MKYLMKQLKRLQGAEGLVTNELRSMKNHTKALINHLQKIVKIIVSVFFVFPWNAPSYIHPLSQTKG